MSDQTIIQTRYSKLINKFPDGVAIEDRAGFKGVVVNSDHLVEVAKTLRDDFGYDYLSSVTGVDDFPEDRMEVVYHLYKSIGGSEFEFKVFTSRLNPTIPSLTPLFPGAEFQEREIWDLYGICFTDHPDLRRILMWEGFDGFPLRKDWKEPFFEEDTKPFKSRWPEGKAVRSETLNPFEDNI
jgi:NADH-quinone oxidoreductase subunit C/D